MEEQEEQEDTRRGSGGGVPGAEGEEKQIAAPFGALDPLHPLRLDDEGAASAVLAAECTVGPLRE